MAARENAGHDDQSFGSAQDKPLQLYGQEFNHVTFAIAKMNMNIHDMEGQIVISDTLRNPKLLKAGANGRSPLRTFDLVTANPMRNQDGYTAEFYENDPFERATSYPPASSAD